MPSATVWEFRAITATDRSTAQNAPWSRMAMTDVSTQAWRGGVDVDAWQAIGPGGPAEVGELVADLILAPEDDPMADEPEVAAWIGLHRHDASRAAEPGGGAPTDMPLDAPSHAFCKIEEAIAWAQLPMEAGQCAVELGAAPGGAVLALARRGLDVVAVDLGDLAAQVLASPGVTHLAKKVGSLGRADLPARVDWLLVDMNLAPQVVLHEIAHLLPGLVPTLRGAVFTLKLPDWAVVDELPRLVAQIAAFGLPDVRLRHLPSNRREVCCVARPAR
ncbi:MAG: hypothetical protein NT062_11650 [Proteobacteria bacterium]|nr:hypothetical protein [Pseudomonadota bacterium]